MMFIVVGREGVVWNGGVEGFRVYELVGVKFIK